MISDLLSRDTPGERPQPRRCDSRQESMPVPGTRPRRCRSVSLVSGQCGAGTSFLARQLSLALCRQGYAVCLFDDPPGASSLRPEDPPGHMAEVLAGHRTLVEIIQHGPRGLRSVAGARDLPHLRDCSPRRRAEVVEQILALEAQCDFLVIDAGSKGATETGGEASRLAWLADAVCLVATPEPRVVPETLELLRHLTAGDPLKTPRLILNQADSPEQAQGILARIQQGARAEGRSPVTGVGYIPFDQAASRAVFPDVHSGSMPTRSVAAEAIDQIAHRLASTIAPLNHVSSCLSSLFSPPLPSPSVASSVV
jgi:flagellar biosynthesis protein FlhG